MAKFVRIDGQGRVIATANGDVKAGPGDIVVAEFPSAGQIYVDGQWVTDPTPQPIPAPVGQEYKQAFLMLCDTVANRTTHEKLAFEQLPSYMKPLKTASPEQYADLRDAFMTINMALINKCGPKWWDECVWDPSEEMIAAGQQVLAALQ